MSESEESGSKKSSLKEKSLKEIQNMAKQNLNEELHDKLSNKQLFAGATNDLYASYYNYACYNTETSQKKQQLHDATKYPDYNYAYNLYKESEKKKLAEKQPQSAKATTETKQEQKSSNLKQNSEKPTAHGKQTTTAAPQKTNVKTSACNKRFSIGNYAHLLNEPVVPPTSGNQKHDETESITGEQIIDKYYDTLKGKNKRETTAETNKKQEATNVTSSDVNKIAANLVSSGKSKWKNSSKSATTETSKFLH